MTTPASDSRIAALDPPSGGVLRATGGLDRALSRLDDISDWISPIVVKEVRQIVRGREFAYSFLAGLAVGLLVASIGAARAAGGVGTSGRWVFMALTGCLTVLGVVIVPLGAFSALRSERLEQTMDLVTVTALSPFRVIVGKLFAQAVKLTTLFAGMAPFIATSFLLGGIDFLTILVSLVLVFLGSLWVCAAALLLASIPKTRAMFGVVFAGIGVVALLPFVLTFAVRLVFSGSVGVWFSIGGGVGGGGGGGVGAGSWWWTVAALVAIGLVSMVNLVLLAENRLSSPVEDKATALRTGFFVQFLLVAGILLALWYVAPAAARAVDPLVVLSGLHLAVVAGFTITEDFTVSRRVLLRARESRWRWLNPVLRSGGGHGALYVLAQMALLVAMAWLVDATAFDMRWVLAICGYICFFTAVPTLVLRTGRRGLERRGYAGIVQRPLLAWHLRVALLLLLAASVVLPDLLYYLLWRPETFSLTYASRHIVNPLWSVADWEIVDTGPLAVVSFLMGATGVVACAALFVMNRRSWREQDRAERLTAGAGDGDAARVAAD